MKTILKRFSEPSTWAGLSGLALAFGYSTDEWQTIATAGAAVCGVVAMLLKEKSA